ncbi:MAG: hypothetical protein K6D59_02935 [Bacteroidales bacterium]|nr:hypothetical protein [Bacteroidales bacterium]
MEKKDELIIIEHLRSIGMTRDSITEKKWEQLCSIYEAIKTLEKNSADLVIQQRLNTITIANIERVINCSPGHHISHALFFQKNKNGLLNRFIATFNADHAFSEKEEKKRQQQVLFEEKLMLLAKRDYSILLLEQDLKTLIGVLKRNSFLIPKLKSDFASSLSRSSEDDLTIPSLVYEETKGGYN